MPTRLALIALQTLLFREIRRFMRIWVQTLVPPVITMSLYFIIFGSLIGSRIGEMGGYDYMQFIVPGLIMMSVITNSYSNVASSFFSHKYQKSIEEILVSPTPNYVILLGFVGGGVARGVVVGFLVTLLSLFFIKMTITNIFLTVVVIFLTATVFSLGGFLNAMFANKFDDVSIVPTFILTPLTYLGGVFYSVSLLPDLWQGVSMANPILYMINAFRYGILGVSDVNVLFSLVMILFFLVFFTVLSLYLLKKGIGIRQ